MDLIKYEIRMSHVLGPDHDWWQQTDTRTYPIRTEGVVAQLEASDRYRNISVEPDPHDDHPSSAIETSLAGLSRWCTVPGCTWSWDYD